MFAPSSLPKRNTRREKALRTSQTVIRSDHLTLIIFHLSQWSNQIVTTALIPDEHNDTHFASLCGHELLSQAHWAAHLSLHAFCIGTNAIFSPGFSCARTANTISSIASICSRSSIWFRCPSHGSSKEHDPWATWDAIRSLCNSKWNLGVAVEVCDASEPPEDAFELERWIAEPVHAVIVRPSAFERNSRDLPIFPGWARQFVERMLQLHVQLVLSVDDGDGKEHMSSDEAFQHWQYLAHVFNELPTLSNQEHLEAPYRDFLQSPLQPLSDNLESQTYEVFERDDAKYTTYANAIQSALFDLTKQDCKSKQITAVVAGAGRGPLVLALVNAAQEVELSVGDPDDPEAQRLHIVALEKNPNAVLTLEALCAREGWQESDAVRVEQADVRDWSNYPAEGIDLVVSELLGSFGDNELSPECLDGASNFLKPNGIVIPRSYSSHVSPLASSSLQATTHALAHNSTSCCSGVGNGNALETHHVVKPYRALPLDEPKQVWRFDHPKTCRGNNERYAEAEFENTSSHVMAVHGLIGYFDAELYGGKRCSIHPENHTEGMFSWFPMFFPFRQSQRVQPGSSLKVHMWRRVGARRVWLEWAHTQPTVGAVHNQGGHSCAISLT